jgi:hypothetical protein
MPEARQESKLPLSKGAGIPPHDFRPHLNVSLATELRTSVWKNISIYRVTLSIIMKEETEAVPLVLV